MGFAIGIDHTPPPPGIVTVILAETEEEVRALGAAVTQRGPQWTRTFRVDGPGTGTPWWSVTILETATMVEQDNAVPTVQPRGPAGPLL